MKFRWGIQAFILIFSLLGVGHILTPDADFLNKSTPQAFQTQQNHNNLISPQQDYVANWQSLRTAPPHKDTDLFETETEIEPPLQFIDLFHSTISLDLSAVRWFFSDLHFYARISDALLDYFERLNRPPPQF